MASSVTPERALAVAIVRLAKEAETPDELLALATAYEKLVCPGGPVDRTIHLTGDAQMLDCTSSFNPDEDRVGFRAGGSNARVIFFQRELP